MTLYRSFLILDMNVNFANPVGPYDLMFNRCAGKYCHVEISLKMNTDLFRVLVQTSMDEAYDPAMLEDVLKRTKGTSLRTLHVCFYIMWGGVVSVRFLNTLTNDPLMRPPELPVYDTLHVSLNDDEIETVVRYNIKQLGRAYDIPRAVFLLTRFTLRLDGEPKKFFCSQLVMYTFRAAKLYTTSLESISNINHMSPTDVFEWLSVQKPRSQERENKSEDKPNEEQREIKENKEGDVREAVDVSPTMGAEKAKTEDENEEEYDIVSERVV